MPDTLAGVPKNENGSAPGNAPAKSRDLRPWLFLAIGIVIGALGFLAVSVGVHAWQDYSTSGARFLAANKSGDKAVVETASGLQYKVLTPGTGTAKPTDADITLVTYEGKLTDGTTFDKSEQPTPIPVKGVVPGFSEALKLMPKGAKYRFWLKPSLGYGDKATGPIPANSVLVFDVQLIDFISEAALRQAQMQQELKMQGRGAAQAETAPSSGR